VDLGPPAAAVAQVAASSAMSWRASAPDRVSQALRGSVIYAGDNLEW